MWIGAMRTRCARLSLPLSQFSCYFSSVMDRYKKKRGWHRGDLERDRDPHFSHVDDDDLFLLLP